MSDKVDNDNLGVCGLCGRDVQSLERQLAAAKELLREACDSWKHHRTASGLHTPVAWYERAKEVGMSDLATRLERTCGEISCDDCNQDRTEALQRLAAAEADEATCHCGLRMSQHDVGSGHTACEMERPCPYAEQLAAAEELLTHSHDRCAAGELLVTGLTERIVAAEAELVAAREVFATAQSAKCAELELRLTEALAKFAAAEARIGFLERQMGHDLFAARSLRPEANSVGDMAVVIGAKLAAAEALLREVVTTWDWNRSANGTHMPDAEWCDISKAWYERAKEWGMND